MKLLFATATLTAAMLASMATAQAATETNELSSNGVSHCQGALPNFEGALRKRPLAVDNVSTGDAFVTCAYELRGIGALGHRVDTWFGNNSTVSKTINCTGVQGFNGASQAVTRSVTIPAGLQGVVSFGDADFATGIDGLFAISCKLPAGTGVNDTYGAWLEDDGATP